MKLEKSFRERFKGGSPRLFGYDYSYEGYYFITMCTKDRFCYFGEIKEGKMSLSKSGEIVKEEWLKTGEIRKDDQITLDEFCIMPNHVHCIITVGDPILPSMDRRIPQSNFKVNQFGPQIKNISSIIRGFKGACTKRIHTELQEEFAWQRKFYDHIVRDQSSLENIRRYIRENPRNWKNDDLR